MCIRDIAVNVADFRAAVELVAQTLADNENIIVDPSEKVQVSTFLRIGVAHTWHDADYLETRVRQQIYMAAFGSLDARGSVVAKDDPSIAGVATIK